MAKDIDLFLKLTEKLSERGLKLHNDSGGKLFTPCRVSFTGDYDSIKGSDLALGAEAGVDVPTEPVDADAKVGWWRKRSRKLDGVVTIEWRLDHESS